MHVLAGPRGSVPRSPGKAVRVIAQYHLALPEGFQTTSAAAVDYSVYPASGPAYAVSSAIGTGRQPSYLGVTVLGTSFSGDRVAVSVKTGRLTRPMTLRIAARGTVS